MMNKYFWELIKEFNDLMRTAIGGPDCTNPLICQGDCCSIQIDVPKVLAKEYIKRKIAKKEDFIRSDIFSFKLRFYLKAKLYIILSSSSETKPISLGDSSLGLLL